MKIKDKVILFDEDIENIINDIKVVKNKTFNKALQLLKQIFYP